MPKKAVTHLIARYHMYVIASMKQLVASDTPKREKAEMLSEMFHSEMLRASLSVDVIKVHKASLKLFFTLIKLRCYLICKLLLYFKIKG